MISEVRQLLEGERYGVLATLSTRRDGWPFASVTAYALDEDGQPLLLLSNLAEHTRNLRADPRASLLVTDSSAGTSDPQAATRATLLGAVEVVSDTARAAARQHYVAQHPQSEEYLQLSDFRLYVLRAVEARFIKGFGEMGWVNLQKETA